MTKRDIFYKYMKREKVPIIPCFENFMDTTACNHYKDYINYQEKKDSVEESMQLADICDDWAVRVYKDIDVVERRQINRNQYEIVYETGAKWREIIEPMYNREVVYMPFQNKKDFRKDIFPDPHDPKRYEGISEKIKYYHEKGYLVKGSSTGFWGGLYYFLRKFEDLLCDMLIDEGFFKNIVELRGEYLLGYAEELLKRDVDFITVNDDLGSSTNLLFSEKIYKRYFYPYHKRLAKLCHRYGKFFRMHSHGHIERVMDMIVDAGVDIINPVGPSDNNDLSMFKRKWGDKIFIHGGISTHIKDMNKDEMEKHLRTVVDIGCEGSGFSPRTESGIPQMPGEKTSFYLKLLKQLREEKAG